MYEMLEGEKPFKGANQNEVMKKIVNDGIDFPPSFSVETKSLLEGLLCKDVPKRLGSTNDAEEIKSHSYFKDINWESMLTNIEMQPLLPPMEDIRISQKQHDESHVTDSTYKPKVSFMDSYKDFTYARATLDRKSVV